MDHPFEFAIERRIPLDVDAGRQDVRRPGHRGGAGIVCVRHAADDPGWLGNQGVWRNSELSQRAARADAHRLELGPALGHHVGGVAAFLREQGILGQRRPCGCDGEAMAQKRAQHGCGRDAASCAIAAVAVGTSGLEGHVGTHG